jgi:Trk-type K+ transport system membrane component
VLMLAMWIGRLEVVTVLALLRPEVWRMARWRD